MRVDDICIDENGNYLGEDNKASKEVRVMNKGFWDQQVEKDENRVATESGTEYAQNNSTALSEYEHGIAISDGTWNTIEEKGGEKMIPSVQNNSSVEALVLPKKFDEKQ